MNIQYAYRNPIQYQANSMATTTSALGTLKLAIFTKPAAVTAAEFRRNKLAARLREQMALAEAERNGTVYAATRRRTVTDAEGVRSTVTSPKRVKHWWNKDAAGKLILTVRYGSRLLELGGKGKNAVEIADIKQLVPTLKIICDAVLAGELDAEIAAASAGLKAGFKR
jgi:hypothetical protein